MSDHKIKNKESLLSHGDAGAKAQVLELTERVLQRLDARKRLHEMMHREGSELVIGRRRHDLSRYRHVYAFSSGKAGNHMARAFEDLLGEYLTLGVTIIKLRDEEDVYRKTEVYVGGHPLPNEEGIRGCQRMIDIAEQMGPDDLLLLGLTGGCSALMGYPVEGTTLEDLQEATDVMLKAGMWVMDINDIRGHLSRMSRGRLGQHIHGAKILCFEIWDAVGLDDITDYTEPVPIMGTPVGYDTVTFEDIGAILRKYHIEDKLPPNVARYLLDYDPAQETPQTMTNDVDYYIVNTLPDSCQAALEAAEEMGIPAHVLTTYAEGESRDYGTFMASLAHEVVKNERPFRAPCFLFSAGETTTAIPDSSLIRGHGGPSQEMTAAFAVAAEGLKNVCLLSMDSEGTDGTTPVAGGLTDGTTGTAAAERGIDLRKALREHAAYEALEPLGDTVLTGNTGTNLCDFNVLYIGTQEYEKSTHNRRERPVYGHCGWSRGRFYYRITTFEGRPWDARDPHKTTFMALKHAIRLSIWRKQKETPGVEKAPGVSLPQRKESGRSGRDTGSCGSGCDPAIHARRLRVYHRPRRLRMASRISIILYSRRFSPANLIGAQRSKMRVKMRGHGASSASDFVAMFGSRFVVTIIGLRFL